MITLIKGYKQGRAVMFYDAFDELKQKKYTKVPKDEVVKFCDNGLISNAKVQWWEGKAIVRVSNNIPLVKITNDGEVSIEKSVHNSNKEPSKAVESVVISSGKKRITSETDYKSYMMEDIVKHRELKSSVSMNGIDTVSDMFDMIAEDFRLKNIEKYKQSFATKININRKLNEMAPDYRANLMENIAVYLMNMANIEIRDVYLKYSSVVH
jgi:hypothetical protein